MKKIRIIGLILSLTVILGTLSAFANNASQGIRYDQPIKVTLKNKGSDPEKEFKFITPDDREVLFIVNKLNDKSFVLAPLENVEGMTLKKLAPKNVVSVTAYTGEIFVQNKKNLQKIKSLADMYRYDHYNIAEERSTADVDTKSAPLAQAGESRSLDPSKSSETNVQVKGVDEADIAKVVGDRIYFLSPGELYIAKVDQGKIVEEKKIDLKRGEYISEMYADGDRIVLIGHTFKDHKQYTTATVYDVKNVKDPKVYRSLAQEGNYSSSRKIGNRIYLISTTYINDLATTAEPETTKSLDLATLRFFPSYITDSVTTISSFAIDDKEPTVYSNFMGEAHNIYMNDKSLYISYTEYRGGGWIPRPIPFEGTPQLRSANEKSADLKETIDITPEDDFLDKTIIKKFNINKGKMVYVAEAKIIGTLINQFAMDESNGFFRVAHTRSFDSGSEVSVFDKNMKQVGNLKAIAPGERIYSARFMGEKLYLVTFKQVDPFFVIDLKDPRSPKILGYLKIPGYSDYLHPYDENHIIGFGKDTSVDLHGRTLNLGMKIAMFDVTNVKDPKMISNVIIGDHGTYSELLQNHKALMYNAEKSYFGFPVSISKQRKDKEYWYTDTVFEGAHIYEITKDFKIKFKGQTEHRNPGQRNDNSYSIRRIVYVGDYIYSMSWGEISSNRVSDMKEIQKIAWS